MAQICCVYMNLMLYSQRINVAITSQVALPTIICWALKLKKLIGIYRTPSNRLIARRSDSLIVDIPRWSSRPLPTQAGDSPPHSIDIWGA
jgi:hypothetical protein